MKTLILLLSFYLLFSFSLTEVKAGAVTGSRNKCYSVGKRFDSHASLRYLSGITFYTDKRNDYDCYYSSGQTFTYNGAYAYAKVGLYVSTQRIAVSKWNAVAGAGYFIPSAEPSDSYGISKGDNGELIEFDSSSHSIHISNFSGYISSTLGTNYGNTLLYVIWKPGSELDSAINEDEVLYRGKISIENGQLIADGFFDQSDYNLTVDVDSLGLPALKAYPVNNLSKVIPISSAINLDDVKVSVFCEGGYGTFHEPDIIIPQVYTLNLKVFIEGFYDSNIHAMRRSDSLKVYIHTGIPPYTLIDSADVILDTEGNAILSFEKRESPCDCDATIKHRSSMETWTSRELGNGTSHLFYDFTSDVNSAYGKNMKQIDAFPVRFGIFSGDVNQDGSIDLNDVLSNYNAATIFLTGYVVNDVNGDNVVDLNDILFSYNNSAAFVSVIRP